MQAAPARLRRYGPGLAQSPHAHDGAHLSLVLAGDFEETVGRRTDQAGFGRLGLRPEGLRHAVRFGRRGALVLTLDLGGADAPRDPAWTPPLPEAQLSALVPLLFEGGRLGQDAAWDLKALASADLAPERPPAVWLADLYEALIEAPAAASVEALAEQAGRHRVHVSRSFAAAFGRPIAVVRRQAMLDQALCALASGQSAVQAALEAGFCDQSHFSRVCSQVTGLAPRALMAHAA